MKTVNLYAGISSNGERVFEEVPVVDLGNSILRVLRSPGLVLGIANGDEIVYQPETGLYDLVKRGGNVAIHLYFGPASNQDIEQLALQLEDAAGATWDGLSERQAVFSHAAAQGFPAIEQLLNDFVAKHRGAEWYYGNVYADDGVTPLNWWLDS